MRCQALRGAFSTALLALAPALLLACEDGPSPETLVDDVQVIAAVAEPVAVAAGEPWSLSTTVADPRDRGAELLVWSCLDDDCTTARTVPDGDLAVLDLVSTAPVPLWILACDPGICDLDDPEPADLLDPVGWMQRLPLEGVSLATRAVQLTEEPVEDRPINPVPERQPDAAPFPIAARDTKDLRFTVPGAQTAYGYSTAGGFGRPSSDVDAEGKVRLTWYAPKDSGAVDLWVVFQDDAGGVTVWRGSAEVSENRR